jgi:hypothetical protein
MSVAETHTPISTERSEARERIPPRLMTLAEAAHYCRMSVPRFKAWAFPHVHPVSGPGRPLYDRHAVDSFIDSKSSASSTSLEAEAIRAAQEYCDSSAR